MLDKSAKHKVIKNFLDPIFFENLKRLIIEDDFPWFKRERQVFTKKKLELGYFTHSFFNNQNSTSAYYIDYILPILNKLNAISVIQVRANLTPSVFYLNNRGSAFHCDYDTKNKTAILYLNTCDGGTDIKINNETIFIEAEENKILIFDSNVKHRGVVSNNSDFRYIINFNYFENKEKNETSSNK